MAWIESIKRRHNGPYEFFCRGLNGQSTTVPPTSFPPLEGVTTKIRATVSSKRHTVTAVDDYLSTLGWNNLYGDNQRLHRFKTETFEIWIPSQAIVQMMLGKVSSVYDTAYCGRSILEIVSPSKNGHPDDMGGGWRISDIGRLAHRHLPNLLRDRYFWLRHSLSASKSFRYIYRNAADGLLDVPLPQGTFDIAAGGKRIGNLLLVNKVQIFKAVCDDLHLDDGTHLSTTELNLAQRHLPPISWRGMSRQSIDEVTPWSLDGTQFRNLLKYMFETGVLGGEEQYTEEHQRVLKRHLELLRARFIGRNEWRTLPCSAQELACVQARYYKMRRAGHWDRVKSTLLAS